jgi:UDP-N-acetyl-D-mannosaminuronic acid dehydrogenase
VVHELVSNDRVIGGLTAKASAMAVALYRTFVEGECFVTSARTAEMCKLTENSFRDVNIAFANELSMICDRLGIDVWELIQLANRHPRVNILQPGTGVGGHCIAVDPWFIVDSTPAEARLIRTAREVNDHKPHWVLDRIQAAAGTLGLARPPIVACLGLAFKPDIDDLRESPALEVARAVAAAGCRVLAVEPHVHELPAPLAQAGMELRPLESALLEADVVAVLVRHRQFELAKGRILAAAVPIIDAVGLVR